jgi:hypothetical protein
MFSIPNKYLFLTHKLKVQTKKGLQRTPKHHFRGQTAGQKEKYQILQYLPSTRQLHLEKGCGIIRMTAMVGWGR